MKFLLSFFIILAISFKVVFCEWIPPKKAKIVATNFYKQTVTSGKKSSIDLKLIEADRLMGYPLFHNKTKTLNEDHLIYCFQVSENSGFVIVSSDDRVIPVLGYSGIGSLSDTLAPPAFRKLLENYKSQIREIIRGNIKEVPEIKDEWEKLLEGKSIQNRKSTQSVNPLIESKWSQSSYYNVLCPYDDEEEEYCLTGCVATAMAQVMNYWEYPEIGKGFHSYNHETYGTISANFGATEYQWDVMPNVLFSVDSAVSELMFSCGVSVDMKYGVHGSSAQVISAISPIEQCTEFALKEYFGYDNNLTGIQRMYYSITEWKNILKNELNNNRPIIYAGKNLSGGHAFVCDGYDSFDYFHFNWGWGGSCDGYFFLDGLSPSGGEGYNYCQHAIIGIQPPSDYINYELSLYESISSNPFYFVNYGFGFSIHTNIANTGNTDFQGDFCAAIFDKNDVFIDYVEILTDYKLSSGYCYTNGLTFNYPGSYELLPGFYEIIIFYRPTDGNWEMVSNWGGNYNYHMIYVSHNNFMELYEPYKINNDTCYSLIRNQPYNVDFNVVNTSTTIDFSGSMRLNFYHFDGSFAEAIDIQNDMELPSNCYYSNGLSVESEGTELLPGTYLMALQHKPDWDVWQLVGSTYQSNPIKVTIKSEPLEPDRYESNDSLNTAYQFVYEPSIRTDTIITAGSNIHSATDYDYFMIDLPEGDEYVINARAYDSYSSGDGNTYTNDVMYAYYKNGEWSEVYDDVMPDSVFIENGGKIIFAVVSYFYGMTGTYSLELSITNNTKNFPPVLSKIPVIEMYEDSLYKFNIAELFDYVDDQNPEDTCFNLNWSFLPGLKTNINHSDSILEISGYENYFGQDSVKIIVDDGTLFDSTYLRIIIHPVNDLPIITSSLKDTIYEDGSLYHVILTMDVESDELSISITDIPVWIEYRDSISGVATLRGIPDEEHVGDYILGINVSDGKDTLKETIHISVIRVNDPPYFTSSPDTTIEVGNNYLYLVKVYNEEDEKLTFTTPSLPQWLTLDTTRVDSVVLAGTPSQSDIGICNVTICVCDDSVDNKVSQVFSIYVEAGASGLTDNDLEKFVIFPNPVKDIVHVLFSNEKNDEYQIYISTIEGKIVKHIRNITNGSIEINCNDLPSGLYILELVGKQRYHGRFVINSE